MNLTTSAPRGFSMIEMLVGVLIISFGLLGLIQLQSRALQASVSSEDSQRAALLASEMAAIMANANTVALGTGVLAAWEAKASDVSAGGLPNGVGTVTVTGDRTATVSLVWTPPQAATGATNETRRYTTTVVVPTRVVP